MKAGVKDTFRRVLVVEDDRRVREMLLDAVADMGFDVTGVPSAEAALKTLAADEPPALSPATTAAAAAAAPTDIAILDLNLPVMNGLDLFEQIHHRWPAVQVIVLTGYGDLEAAKRAIRLDVIDFLSKPCALGELERAIQRARSRRAAAAAVAVSTGPTLAAETAEAAADPTPAGASAADASPAPDVESLEDLERAHIFAALRRHHGNREQSAAALGISVRKLYYRLQQYEQQGLIPPELRPAGS